MTTTAGAKKLSKELELVLNERIWYKGGNRTWATVIFLKAQKLAHYLLSQDKGLDFSEPALKLEREDNFQLRQKTLNIQYSKAKDYGLGKGTLAYMKQNAKSTKPFKVYSKVMQKLRS